MLDEQDLTNIDEKGIPFTVRSVFIIDPAKKIRLTLQYPASTGRQFNEVLRCIDSLQLGDKHKITTPANWTPGEKVSGSFVNLEVFVISVALRQHSLRTSAADR